jgi:LPPG:FO 2-phospho-L-lactate transferase
MTAQKLPVSVAGVVDTYQDFLDFLIVDSADAQAAQELARAGLDVHCTNTIMKTNDDRTELARAVLSFVSKFKKLEVAS